MGKDISPSSKINLALQFYTLRKEKSDTNLKNKESYFCMLVCVTCLCVRLTDQDTRGPCECQRDARDISTEPCISRRKISEEVTDMPGVLSFIGWLLEGLSFIGWLLRGAYLLLAGSS